MDRPANVTITIASNPKRVRIHFNAHVIADTRRALKLREGACPAVQYVPREDVHMFFLELTFHRTYCPHKGEAAYYSIIVGGRVAKNAVWTYEDPYPTVPAIKGYLAFYPERVDRIEELPWDATPDSIRGRLPTLVSEQSRIVRVLATYDVTAADIYNPGDYNNCVRKPRVVFNALLERLERKEMLS